MAKCRMLSAECFPEKEMAGGKLPGSRLLSNASSTKKREARAFPPAPSEDRVVRALARRQVFTAAAIWVCPKIAAVGNSTQL